MYKTIKKKHHAIGLLALTACMVLLSGCKKGSSEEIDLSEITYVSCSADQKSAEMYVISSDYKVVHYTINSTEGKLVIRELFDGKLPDEGYTSEALQITEENWNIIEEAVNETEYIYIPAEISDSEQGLGDESYYIEIKTGMIKHLAGGQNAGFGKDKSNKRFRSVLDAVKNALA